MTLSFFRTCALALVVGSGVFACPALSIAKTDVCEALVDFRTSLFFAEKNQRETPFFRKKAFYSVEMNDEVFWSEQLADLQFVFASITKPLGIELRPVEKGEDTQNSSVIGLEIEFVSAEPSEAITTGTELEQLVGSEARLLSTERSCVVWERKSTDDGNGSLFARIALTEVVEPNDLRSQIEEPAGRCLAKTLALFLGAEGAFSSDKFIPREMANDYWSVKNKGVYPASDLRVFGEIVRHKDRVDRDLFVKRFRSNCE